MSLPKTLLLVEDNDAYRQIVCLSLSQRLPGCRIVEAASVQGAHEMCAAEEPEMAVLDMTLPDGMATDILADWQPRLKNGLKVVVFSSYEPEEVAPALLQLGAHGYVNKDRGIKPLVQAIQAVAEGSPAV